MSGTVTYFFTGSRTSDQAIYDSLTKSDVNTARVQLGKIFSIRPTSFTIEVVVDAMNYLAEFTPRDRDKVLHALRARPEPKRATAFMYARDAAVRINSGLGIKDIEEMTDRVAEAIHVTDNHLKPRLFPHKPAGAMPSITRTDRRAPLPSPVEATAPDIDLTAEFADQLRRIRRWAGDPSYGEIGTAIGYSTATISRAFAGKTLPRWSLVELLLEHFRVPNEQIENEWRRHWLRAREQVDPIGLTDLNIPDPAPTRPPEQDTQNAATDNTAVSSPDAPNGQTCEICGAWVTDQIRHRTWHQDLERAFRRTSA